VVVGLSEGGAGEEAGDPVVEVGQVGEAERSGCTCRCKVRSRSTVMVELRLAAVRSASRPKHGGLFQVAGEEMGEGEVGLGHAQAADRPGLAAAQRHGAERDGLLGIIDTTETFSEVPPNPLTM
jgi:hypothetical protein